MIHYATKLRFLEDVKVELTYLDGKVIQFDMSNAFSKHPQLEELRRDRKFFESGHLDFDGSGIEWNDELDFSTSSIYECGIVVGQIKTQINSQIGFLLSMAREKQNITQTQLAKLTHIDQGDISRIERGIGNPTLKKIEKLFDALGVSLDIKVK